MPAVKQKDGTWKVKKRDGTLGKRKFSTQANALAAQRGAPGGKKKGTRSKSKSKSKAVSKTTRRSPAKKGNPNNAPAKPPKIGASYTAGKAGAFLLAPVTDEIISGIQQGTPAADVIRAAGAKIKSIPYVYNLAVIALDAGIDKKTAQATALTMGSATAWLPEIYLATLAFAEVTARQGQATSTIAQTLHQRLVVAHQGYDPKANAIRTDSVEFRTYRALRHVGQGIRMARGKSGLVKRLTQPAAKIFKMFGGRP